MKKAHAFRGARVILFITAVILLAASIFSIVVLEPSKGSLLAFDVSRVVLDQEEKILSAYLSSRDEWCIPVSLDKMGRWTAKIVVAVEDKRFYEHHGIDFLAIARALYDNARSRKVISGASTITAQVIRISNPRPRTIMVKAKEFWSAMRLESKISKNEILELYLNRAPFGGNIRGVEAASIAYFNKNASALSLAESALLVSLVKSPSRLRPDRYLDEALKARYKILAHLYDKKIISRENMQTATNEPVFSNRYSMPRNASMACAYAIANSANTYTIRSTINSKYQRLLLENLKSSLNGLNRAITSAGIIVNNTDGSILAYVGNARHGEPLPGAQVDCGNAPRSPGSTLKPFIYAKAIERGLLTPATLLADTPISFRGSAPRNFDNTHRGPVTARSALALSLNTPAVRVLRMLGYPATRSLFNELGFSHINKNSSYYADSLVLGGCEVTLLELAAAFKTLANEGNYTPLKWTKGDDPAGKRIYTPEAAWITANILQDERRLIPLYQETHKDNNQLVSFKTGTSHGLRDGWSAGFSKRFTIIVWFGIPDGRPSDALVGLDIAAPAMLKIFKGVWTNDDATEALRPSGLYTRHVCALSGLPPGRYCLQTVKDFAIKDISPTILCELHKNVDGRLVTQFPKELDNWFQYKGRSEIPTTGIKITRPFDGRTIAKESPASMIRIFFSAEGPTPHYWYIDGRFQNIDTIGNGLFFDIPIGHHRAAVLSGQDSDSINFDVSDTGWTNRDTQLNIIN
jgi:penicillin-binding protein 1C